MIALLDAIYAIHDLLTFIPSVVWCCFWLALTIRRWSQLVDAKELEERALSAAREAFFEVIGTADEKNQLLTDIEDLGHLINAMREHKLPLAIKDADGNTVRDLEDEQTDLIHRVVTFREKYRLRGDQESAFVKAFDEKLNKIREQRGERRRELKQKPLTTTKGLSAPKYDSEEFKNKRRV